MFTSVSSRFLVGLITIGTLLSPSNSAECNTFETVNECEPISGCFWNVDHCDCASDITMDVAFLLDSSGSIGADEFQIELDWVVQILDSTLPMDARVAYIWFSAGSGVVLDFATSEDMSTTQRQDKVREVPYMAENTWTDYAINDAIDMFEQQSGDEISKVMILITDGKPTTNHGVCNLAPTLKAMGVTTVIIGVGYYWDVAAIDCLVTDDSHIIKVNSYSAEQLAYILPVISDVTCPVDYNFILTEVKLDSDENGDGSRFVEIFNEGVHVSLKDVEVHGIFQGKLANQSDDTTLGQSKYLVLYDADIDDMPSCVDCNCELDENDLCVDAVYVECCDGQCPCKFAGEQMSNEQWAIYFMDSAHSEVIDEVTYENNTWPSIEVGFAYELKYTGFDNDIGDNWQQSCFERGTPGHSPVVNCSTACTPLQCKVNGADNAQCEGGVNGVCDCSVDAGYYYSDGTCKKIPPPGVCYATFLRQPTKRVEFVWEKAATDRAVNYSLSYFVDGGGMDKLATSVRIKSVSDYDYSRGFDAIPGYVRTLIGSAKSELVECWPLTLPPTTTTTERFVSTTPEPTVPWKNPRFWVSGDLCSEDRCECNGEEWDCEGEEITRTFAAANEPQFVSFKKWQEEYPWLVSVQWQIKLLNSEYDNGDEDEQGENEERRRLFEFERMGNSKTTETTESPLTIAETTEEPLSDTEFGIDPRRGVLVMNGTESEKRISFEILKQLVSEKRRYRLYKMTLGPCENEGPHECELAYPSSFFMEVDINGGEKKVSESSSWRLPWWLWPMIVALLVIPAVLTYIGYKHWTNERMIKAELRETQHELSAANEDHEMGFGRDLDAGDVTFNPMATGLPGVVPAAGNDYMTQRRAAASVEYVHDPVEKFGVRSEMGPAPAAPSERNQLLH